MMTGDTGTRAPHLNMPVEEIALNCGHTLLFRGVAVPDEGSEVWCARCDKYCHRPYALEIGKDGLPILREWEWRCTTGPHCNCGRRKYGQDMRGAYTGARRHSVSNAGHEVVVISPTGGVRDRWTVGGALFDRDGRMV